MVPPLSVVADRIFAPSKARSTAHARDLADISAPWRTKRQLARMEAVKRYPHETFKFAVMGDAEPGRFWVWRKLFNRPDVFETQVRRVQAEACDFTVQLGDMVSRGTPHNYLAFFEGLNAWGVTTPYLSVIGNHDRRFPHGVTDADTYRSCFGPVNYAFDRGGWRFVSLDSSAHRVTPGQLRWLERVILDGPRTILFTHIPPVLLSEWTDYHGAKGLGGFEVGAVELTDLLARKKVARVYMGHIHGFGVQDYKGVRYVLSGGGGSPLFPSGVQDRFHHYLVIEAGPDGLSEVVRSFDGRDTPIPRGRVHLARG